MDFHHVHRKGQRLSASRLGYAVKCKGCLSGRREPSDIWQHGVQLQYIEDNGDSQPTKIWLCKICHQRRDRNDAMAVSGTTYIASHPKKVHSIDPSTSCLLSKVPIPKPRSPFATAAHIPGSSLVTSHMAWEEESFQISIVDWTIMRDLSFADVTSPLTRGMLTWNQSNLLHALPDSRTTLSSYINKRARERKAEVSRLLQTAAGKISISADVWTSGNHISFLAIDAHFVGKFVPN